MSVASQSGSKVLVEILDVMLSLSLSLRAITPGCGGGGIWMLCSLVAWEEEDDAWAVSCDECGALDFDEAGGVRVVVPSPKQIVSGCQRYPRNFRQTRFGPCESRDAANFLEGLASRRWR
jgi:hypothetical protein